jgi:flagellar motility protein MotE (MotC chaperone)
MSCGDGGVDIFGSYKGYTLLVQCKNYSTAKVGASEIDAFEGVMSRHGKSKVLGIFVTSIQNGYSLNAIDKAESSNHNLLLTNILDMHYDIPGYLLKKSDDTTMKEIKEMKEEIKEMKEEIKARKAMDEEQKRTIENQGVVIRNQGVVIRKIKNNQNILGDHQMKTADHHYAFFLVLIFLFIIIIIIILIK